VVVLTDGRRVAAALAAGVVAAVLPAAAAASGGFVHGSAGVGDPFFPRAGNGGYEVSHYELALRYTPARDRLRAVATIRATATEGLSRFDLDLRGLHVSSVRVDGKPAGFRRHGQELVVTPRRNLSDGERFRVRVQYRGKPHPVIAPDGSKDGWIPTPDGAFVADEPQGAPTWFPCNDHPTDKATYDFRVTVPRGIVAVANGEVKSFDDTETRKVAGVGGRAKALPIRAEDWLGSTATYDGIPAARERLTLNLPVVTVVR